MIEAQRITIAGSVPYENVKIYTGEDQPHGVPIYFEDSQIAFSCSDGKFIVSVFQITAILISSGRKTLPPDISHRYKRLTISGEMTFSPAYVLDPMKHDEAGVPLIFRPYEQFTFACVEGLYVTSDYNVTIIEM